MDLWWGEFDRRDNGNERYFTCQVTFSVCFGWFLGRGKGPERVTFIKLGLPARIVFFRDFSMGFGVGVGARKGMRLGGKTGVVRKG